MTIDEIKSKYSDRILGMLESAAQVVRLSGFHVPPPVLVDASARTKHIFWWTDAEDERKAKQLQLQFMAGVSEEITGKPDELRFSFCLYDLQFGLILGCRDSDWVNRNNPKQVEEAFTSIASRWPILLTQVRKAAETIRE